MLLIILKILAVIVLLICLGFILYWLIAVIKGDCSLHMLKKEISPLKVEDLDFNSITVSFTIPIINTGKQIGTIMDAFVRTYLPFEQFDKARVSALLTAADAPRDDGYWQAFIMEKRKPKYFLIKLHFRDLAGQNILDDLKDFPDMDLDIIYQVVARSDYYYAKTRLTITHDDLMKAIDDYKKKEGR